MDAKSNSRASCKIFPEGQIGVEYQGKLVASSSSLILDFELYKEWHSHDEISADGFISNHKPDGTTLYGIEMMVHPNFRGLKLARRLYDARKHLARERNLMRIVVGGRIPGYAAHAKEMTAREYIEKVINKTLFDPVLTTQVANGFVLKRLIPGYLASDVESQGYAAFLEWANLDYRPESAAALRADLAGPRLRRAVSDPPGGQLPDVRRAVRIFRRRRLRIQVRLHPVSGDLHDAAAVA